MIRIGIYSGAFDPVHDGHVLFAKEARQRAGLDKVYFLVEPSPRYKQGVKAFEHRVEMVRLATRDDSGLGVIILEQERFSVHETWPVLQNRFEGAELSMLMGSDVFARLSHWPRVDELITSAYFVVGIREDTAGDFHEHLAMIEKTRHLKLHYTTFPSSLPSESSSWVRQALRQGAVPAGLNPAVAEYIVQNKLYSSGYSE